MWSSFLFWYNLSMKLKLCLINIKFYAVVIQSLSHVWHFPMDCNMPGFPVLHYLPDFAQTHIHCVSDAIQPSHPLVAHFFSYIQSFPALGSFPMSWVFASGGQRIGASASVLPMNIQGWFILGFTGLISLLSKRLSRIFSITRVQSISCLVLSQTHIHTWLLEKP